MRGLLKLTPAVLLAALSTLTLASCSDDDDNNDNQASITPIEVVTNHTEADFSNKAFGNTAIDACATTVAQLNAAYNKLAASKLTTAQEEYMRNTLAGVVDNVIVPTYTTLANNCENLNNTLANLDAKTITQSQINTACEYFKQARAWWEKSEAFLGGAASEFDIDPTIDSWPLNRTLLHTYLISGKSDFTDEELEDATILGFHALEFILFRNGEPRKASEFTGKDTYKNFTDVDGSTELAYAQRVCQLLVERTYQLQVAWEGETTANANRLAVVKKAGLDYKTSKGYSFGENLKNAGNTTLSTFPTLLTAIAQILNMEEGSCVGICNEVGTAKIANPFSAGDISYVESPYSYNSIVDFQNNIRSIQNVWYGGTDGANSKASYSFHNFFKKAGEGKLAANTEVSISNSITAIGNMPSAFVKYVSTIWNVKFEDDETWE